MVLLRRKTKILGLAPTDLLCPVNYVPLYQERSHVHTLIYAKPSHRHQLSLTIKVSSVRRHPVGQRNAITAAAAITVVKTPPRFPPNAVVAPSLPTTPVNTALLEALGSTLVVLASSIPRFVFPDAFGTTASTTSQNWQTL